MGVDFGKVETFEGAKADKAQALKVIEEAAELFAAWQAWEAESDAEAKEPLREAMMDEAADAVQAMANFIVGAGVARMADCMTACMERNEARGRRYAGALAVGQPAEETTFKPCPFCGVEPRVYYDTDSDWAVGCDNAACIIGFDDVAGFGSIIEAAAAWNARAES